MHAYPGIQTEAMEVALLGSRVRARSDANLDRWPGPAPWAPPAPLNRTPESRGRMRYQEWRFQREDPDAAATIRRREWTNSPGWEEATEASRHSCVRSCSRSPIPLSAQIT